MSRKPASWVDVPLTALAPLAWGTTYWVTTELLPPDRPLTAALLRVLPVGLILLAFFRRLPTGRWLWRMMVLGALNIGVFQALLFVAAYRLPGGVAATLGAVQPLLVMLLAWPVLAMKPGPRGLIAGAAGLVGVALLVLTPAARLDGIGIAAALAGAVCMAVGTVLTRKWAPPVPLMLFTAWQLVAGGVLLLPLALLAEPALPPLSGANIAGYLYLGIVGAALSYALWFRGVERLHPGALSTLGLLSPVSATVLGWLALGQALGPVQIVGAIVVLAAVTLGQRRPK